MSEGWPPMPPRPEFAGLPDNDAVRFDAYYRAGFMAGVVARQQEELKEITARLADSNGG